MAATGLKRRLEGDIEIRVAGADAFHDMIVSKPHHVSKASSGFIQDCELHEGDFGKVGSTICWKYNIGGKPLSVKERIEVIDEKNKLMKFKVIEGEILKDYKNFVLTYQVIPKDKHISLVKWIFEYEKLRQGTPEPSYEMDSLVQLAQEIDDHHHGQGGSQVNSVSV